MHVQRKILRARRETKMHEAVIATIIWSPRAAFHAGISLETCFHGNGKSITQLIVDRFGVCPRRCFPQLPETHDRGVRRRLDRTPEHCTHHPKPRTEHVTLDSTIILAHLERETLTIRNRARFSAPG